MPVIPFIPLIAAGVGSAVGGVEASKQQGIQNKALNSENAIAGQELADRQQIFKQLVSFLSPYLQQGSPFLQNIQSAAAGQNAQQFNNAAGQFRQQIGQAGTGYGPSGTMASGLAQLGQGAAQTGAANYLQNLLNNEAIKFQAASGLQGAGTMAGASQNQPNVGINVPAQNIGSSIFGAGQLLGSSIPKTGGGGGGSVPGNLPLPNVPIFIPPSAPTTQGSSTGGGVD